MRIKKVTVSVILSVNPAGFSGATSPQTFKVTMGDSVSTHFPGQVLRPGGDCS